MNERIKEIAKQAGMEDYPTYGVNSLHGEQYISKFAELIVKECAAIADSPDVDILRIGKAIKDHLGVE